MTLNRETIEETAKELAGNHRKFQCFAWFDRPEDDENWALVYTHNRDSSHLEQSNANVIAEALSPFPDDAIPEDHNHWACGWVAGFRLRVFNPDGSITKAFEVYAGLLEKLEDYPVLDEEDWSRREYEDYQESWSDYGASEFVKALKNEFKLLDSTADRLSEVDSHKLMELYESGIPSGEYYIAEGSGVSLNIEYSAKRLTRDQLAAFLKANA